MQGLCRTQAGSCVRTVCSFTVQKLYSQVLQNVVSSPAAAVHVTYTPQVSKLFSYVWAYTDITAEHRGACGSTCISTERDCYTDTICRTRIGKKFLPSNCFFFMLINHFLCVLTCCRFLQQIHCLLPQFKKIYLHNVFDFKNHILVISCNFVNSLLQWLNSLVITIFVIYLVPF